MKDADLDARETFTRGWAKIARCWPLCSGPLNALKSRKWNAEAKYGRFDASYIEEGRTRTKGAEVCSLHNYSKLQCFLPIGEEKVRGPVRSRPHSL